MQKSVRGRGGKDTNRPESVRRSIYYLAHQLDLPPLRLGPMSRRYSPT